MIIRAKPTNIENYFSTNDSRLSEYLQFHSFVPLFIYEKVIYFKKSEELKKVVDEWKS